MACPASGGANRLFEYPKKDAHAFNWQGQLVWQASADTQLHASVSHRARFPTIFERFSTQFGTAASNPGLKPERATNFEIGASHVAGPLRIEGALFYSDINDAIVNIRPAGASATTTKRVNLGSARYYGGEILLNARVSNSLSIGANYTYIRRRFKTASVDPADGLELPFELTDVPKHKAFIYADWSPLAKLHIIPSIDLASKRTTLDTITGATSRGYYRTGSYANASLRVDYEIADGIQISAGGRNLFDDNYQLTDGFPEPGRSFFVGFRGKF